MHKILGICVLLFTATHVVSHVVNYSRWSDPANYELWRVAFPNNSTHPSQPSLGDLWTQPASITGIAILACFTVGYPAATRWPRDSAALKRVLPRLAGWLSEYSTFWTTHRVCMPICVYPIHIPCPI